MSLTHSIVGCRSGTEEEYTELSQLLEDICTYLCDLVDMKNREREDRKKELDDKLQAENMRKATMEGLVKCFSLGSKHNREESHCSPSSSDDSPVEELDDLSDESPPLPKKTKEKIEHTKARRLTKVSAIETLEKKFERKVELKEKELELKRYELELQEKNLKAEEAKCKEYEEES